MHQLINTGREGTGNRHPGGASNCPEGLERGQMKRSSNGKERDHSFLSV